MPIPDRTVDPSFNRPLRCDVCSRDPDDCTCPECPKCGTSGDPICYVDHGLLKGPGGSDMAYRRGFVARMYQHSIDSNPYRGGRWAIFKDAWSRGWIRRNKGMPLKDYE